MANRNVDMIESLVCPPPPTDNSINEDAISSLIVPAPGKVKELHSPDGDSTTAPPSQSSEQSEVKLNNINKVEFQLNPLQINNDCAQDPDVKKIKKVLSELIETEQKYVKDLQFLLAAYLEPLRKEHFWNYSDLEQLYKNVKEIFAFQTKFLRILEESLESDPGFGSHSDLEQFKALLMGIGTAFLYNVDEFKIYSTYCATHSKAQKALHQSADNYPFQEFLASCNPNQQQAHTLESYLIKPIQRILKYPLLLQQLKSLAPNPSEEQNHLTEALAGMENVAEHINEMQRIHEEYGAIFDHLYRQYQRSNSGLHELNPGDLLYYGGVEWLNISNFLGKIKKGLELHAMCFIFRTAVVFLCKERLRSKRKQLLANTTKSNPAEVEIIRYQVLIPVNEVQVKAGTGADCDSEGHFTWELIQLKTSGNRRREKSYLLSNSTPEFRNAFLKTIRQIIRDSVRRMNLPVTPSTSYNGNGANAGMVPKREMDMCSETDSTNECSDFKSELDEEDEHGNGIGAGRNASGRHASGQHAHGSGGDSGGPAGPGDPSVPRKSSGSPVWKPREH
jgi:T-lymphoma invasion and metastasis-inducing protein 1